MNDSGARPAADPGRGLILFDDFCRVAGVEPAGLTTFMRSGQVEGVFDQQDQPFGLFDDVLPGPNRLRALGLVVGNDYDITALSSRAEDGEEEAHEEGCSSDGEDWVMVWHDLDGSS